MTREEAIRILDPETTGEAISEIEYYGGFSGREAAVQALSDACVFCSRRSEGAEHQRLIPVTESDLINRKEILDKLDKWMCTVKRNLYPGLMKTTILDTIGHVTEDIQGMKRIIPEYGNVSGGANEKAT